ncbi:MAG: hypothetical protein LBI99_04280 [Propionibacteriaceae bacterium]|jgi:hypothetical protein|nr:hypothetical protein [Propionibacteriaceae bacterium]
MLSGFHRRVARAVLTFAGSRGFALGGGYAVQEHGLVDRQSADLDAYVGKFDTAPFVGLEQELIEGLRSLGLEAEATGSSEVLFQQFRITDPQTNESVTVDLGYNPRTKQSVDVEGLGPVLSPDDSVIGKFKAVCDRQFERDFIDVHGAMRSGHWTLAEVKYLFYLGGPHLTDTERVGLLREARNGDPDVYAFYGLSPDDQETLFSDLEAVATAIDSGAENWPWATPTSDDYQ